MTGGAARWERDGQTIRVQWRPSYGKLTLSGMELLERATLIFERQ